MSTDSTFINCQCDHCKYHRKILLEHMRENKAVIERLRKAIEKTLDENRHLADGEQCTLWRLKKAVDGRGATATELIEKSGLANLTKGRSFSRKALAGGEE